jgi:uncharacterized membrane protein
VQIPPIPQSAQLQPGHICAIIPLPQEPGNTGNITITHWNQEYQHATSTNHSCHAPQGAITSTATALLTQGSIVSALFEAKDDGQHELKVGDSAHH